MHTTNKWVNLRLICFFLGIFTLPLVSGFSKGFASTGTARLRILPQSESSLPNEITLRNAREMTWSSRAGQSVLSGDVVLEFDSYVLRANQISYQPEGGLIQSPGSVRIENPRGDLFLGKSLKLRTRTGRFSINSLRGRFTLPDQGRKLYISADRASGRADSGVRLTEVSVSPFNMQTPYYDFRASSLRLTTDNYLSGSNPTFRIREIPIFYWPTFGIDLERRVSRWKIRPGYDSSQGLTLEGQYNYLLPTDDWPYLSGIKFDLRQRALPGGGLVARSVEEDRKFKIFAFYANREATFLNAGGNKKKTDEKKDLWLGETKVDYQFGSTDWSLRAAGDWIEKTRFEDDLLSEGESRGAYQRYFDVSLVRRVEPNALFRIDTLRDDRTAIINGQVGFRRTEDVLPQLRYQMFATKIPELGFPLYFGFDGRIRNARITSNSDRFWSSNVNPSLTSHTHWGYGFGQSFTLGFDQQVREIRRSIDKQYESTGEIQFEIRNSWSPTVGQSVDLNYIGHKRVNNQDQSMILLDGRSFGVEKNGFSRHELNFLYRYGGTFANATLKTGYDLRNADTAQIDFDQRIQPPQLTLDARLTSFLSWNQILRYQPSTSEIRQASTEFRFDFNRRLRSDLSMDYVLDQNDNEIIELKQDFLWNPVSPWRFEADYSYVLKDKGKSEINLTTARRFEWWEMTMDIQHVEERDTQVSLGVNFLGFGKQEN